MSVSFSSYDPFKVCKCQTKRGWKLKNRILSKGHFFLLSRAKFLSLSSLMEALKNERLGGRGKQWELSNFLHMTSSYTGHVIFYQKNDADWFVLAVWGYLFIPHFFKTLSESWAGSEDFGAFEIFHFLGRFASNSVEELWGTLERVQSWQRWEAPVFSGRPSVLIMIRMKWRKAFAAHFN